MNRVEVITEAINSHHNIELISEFNESVAHQLSATIQVEVKGIKTSFLMTVLDAYPFQYHDTETISFINKDLSIYNHVNADGSICLHTKHSPESLQNKLHIDLKGLIEWVEKYLINEESDSHYEHPITTFNNIDETIRYYLFTDVDYQFNQGDFGLFSYSKLSDTQVKDRKGETYLIQEFGSPAKSKCAWSVDYQGLFKNVGFYIFGLAPVKSDNGRFVINNWKELEPHLSQAFLRMIWHEKTNNPRIKKNSFVPIILGYNIPANKTHWQAALVHIDNFPNYAEKNKSGSWEGKLHNKEIDWVETIDCSYELFFGRGKFNESLVDKKILLLGLGAVGSLVAETLTRSGAKHIGLVDFDIKEPGNVCRSTYLFSTGVNNKTADLGHHLMNLSPFIEISFSNDFTDRIKLFKYGDEFVKATLQSQLNSYDYIFDCTTDNDMLFILDDLELESTIISLSITNHANELVCTTGKNLYKKTNVIFSQFEQGENDLFNPTGCWSPTFKASYSDISILVNTTLNEINHQLVSEKGLSNFYVSRRNNNVQVCHY
jgi:hypothetical protein